MNTSTRLPIHLLALLLTSAIPHAVAAQEPATTAEEIGKRDATATHDVTIDAHAEISTDAPMDVADDVPPGEDDRPALQEIVSIGHDSTLPAGEKAEAVVSVFGSSTSHGEVNDAVVSILGDTRVTGPVGDAAVAVIGNVYIDSHVEGDAVAVLGNMELGPNARIDGEVVVVGGTLTRASTAVVRNGIEQILGGHFDGLTWLRPWFKHCMLLGRPLAIAPGLGWAWTLTFGFLALYALIALLFRDSVDRCVATFESQPGKSVLAALLALILSPVLWMVLAFTLIGLFLFPLAVYGAIVFGKTVMFALIGKRVTQLFGGRDSPVGHTAVAVLIGGLLILPLYLVPFLGFIVYKLLGFLGLGVVVYTLILSMRRADRSATAAAPGISAASAAPQDTGPAAPLSGTAEPAAAPAGQSRVESVDAASLPRGGFWVRMGALFIDVVMIAIATHFLHGVDDALMLVLAVYGAVMWKLKGTTVGGIVFGLKVVRLDGRPLDWTTSIVRALGCFLSLVVAGLGFLWIAFDDDKQAWHDKIAGTVVVQVPKGVSLI